MPMIVSPLFWEWFNLWLTQFLKDLYHEIKMVALRGGNNSANPYQHPCSNHGNQSQHGSIEMTINVPSSISNMSQSVGAQHMNPNQINLQSLSTISLQFVPQPPPPPSANLSSHNHTQHNHHSHNHNHHSHTGSHNLGHNHNHSHSHNHTHSHNHNHNHSVGHTVGQSHSHSHNHVHGHTQGLSQSQGPSLSQNQGQSYSHSHNHSHSQSQSQSQSQSHSHSHSQSQSHNQSHSQNQSHNQNQNLNHKHEQTSSRYSNSNCGLPSHSHYRLLTQTRPVECYHPSGAAGAAYMPSTTGGTQSSAQAALRVQPTPPQPSAPPAPQQDVMSKTTMAGHNFVSQNQTAPRPQYANFQYRASQHGTRPNSHPRQQQPYIPGAATTTGPVMYPALVFQPPHMGMQTYQQPRSGSPGYYQYMGHHYVGYTNPPSHTSPYYGYATNSPQLPTPNLQSNTSGGRNNPSSLVGPQASPANPTAPTASLSHTQPPTHLHQTMPGKRLHSPSISPTLGVRPAVQKRTHRLPIIDPVTQQDIFSDLYPNDSYLSGESNDRQTPQPEPPTHSVADQFNRMVIEAASQPSNAETAAKSNYGGNKNVELPVSSKSNSQPHNAMSSISSINNNNVIKSELVNINDNRSLGTDTAVEPSETPVVSAISDSPVIVPKMTMNAKPTQRSETIVQSIIDTNKITQSKQAKLNTTQAEKVEKVPEESPASSAPVQAQVAPAPSSVPVFVPAAAPVSMSVQVTMNVPVAACAFMPAPAPAPAPTVQTAPTPAPAPAPHVALQLPLQLPPQPQRQPRERAHKSEDKEKKDNTPEKELLPPLKHNGPASLVISSIDSSQKPINPPTSQTNASVESSKRQPPEIKQVDTANSHHTPITKTETVKKESTVSEAQLSATQLLAASIEKVAIRDQPYSETAYDKKSSAFEAQAKLTQSISSVCRAQQPESKMKDINLNNKTDPDTANGNTAEVTKTETVKEDINKNEKAVKNSKNNSKKSAKMANNEAVVVKDSESERSENCKDETDKVVNVEQEMPVLEDAPEEPEVVEQAPEIPAKEPPQAPQTPLVFVPKYKYSEDQWSPLNKSGKKCYDIGLLKQIKEDPMSKNKPNVPLLETLNVIRTAPMQEPMPFITPISRPVNDSLFPSFVKSGGLGGSRNANPRDAKKDGRNMAAMGKGSVKLAPPPNNNSAHKPVIHVSLSLREDVKLKEVDSAWKPTRFRKGTITEEDQQTQELYKKFRGILNKLTPQKFDTLLDKVKTLEINNQKRLEGVIDLVFEKAIDEPNFSEAYAAMCNKLSMLKVPAENASNPDQCVNFRALIINKCQNQFETDKIDDQVLKIEKELADCSDSGKKKELAAMLEEEQRRIRMRSVGNVRFIGELYKLKMLTCKIMDYCMKYLIDKLEEEKLECLCKLLTTIGEQIENEGNSQLDNIFKKMQEIVERKSNKISSRVKFMIQDVIELRRRKWVTKSVVDSQPKMMDQIQKEAEQHQRHIELMNANPMGGGFRREEGGRGKRGGDNRRQNNFMDNAWKTTRTTNFPVDTSKLKAVTQKNLTNIKLAPHHSWNHGSGTKTQAQVTSNSLISLSNKNMYSVLENVQTDPTSLRGNREMTPGYHAKGASIERSSFNSRGDFSGGNRSGSATAARSTSSSRSREGTAPIAAELPAPAPAVPQEPMADEKMKKSVKSMIDLLLINPDDDELVSEVKQRFPPQYHAALIDEILVVVLEKNAKEVGMVAKSLFHLVSTNTVSADNFLAGMKDTFEFAPDLFIDIPMLYDYLGKFVAPQIEKKHITLVQTFNLCGNIISANQGHLALKSIINNMTDSMGQTFAKNKWQESGLQLNQWMSDDQVLKFLEDNKFEFLEGGPKPEFDEAKIILTPAETQSRLLQLMNSDENCDCIKGWVQDKFGKASNEDWFMRALIQAICEHALYGNDGRDVPHFNQDRMSKYAGLIHEFGESKQSREASCLFGIQHLIHKLEHPAGLTLEVFQYLHEQYLISLDGFLSWESSEKEPEGKGVMLKALTSFFTNIKEADNEDSCSEE